MDDNHFFSIDRLIEFGLGMGMARQMINVMNESMQSMYVPGSIQSMPNPVAQQQIYYVALEGKPVGPLNDSELSQLISQKKVDKNTDPYKVLYSRALELEFKGLVQICD